MRKNKQTKVSPSGKRRGQQKRGLPPGTPGTVPVDAVRRIPVGPGERRMIVPEPRSRAPGSPRASAPPSAKRMHRGKR